jgi:hypothetical protein
VEVSECLLARCRCFTECAPCAGRAASRRRCRTVGAGLVGAAAHQTFYKAVFPAVGVRANRLGSDRPVGCLESRQGRA